MGLSIYSLQVIKLTLIRNQSEAIVGVLQKTPLEAAQKHRIDQQSISQGLFR